MMPRSLKTMSLWAITMTAHAITTSSSSSSSACGSDLPLELVLELHDTDPLHGDVSAARKACNWSNVAISAPIALLIEPCDVHRLTPLMLFNNLLSETIKQRLIDASRFAVIRILPRTRAPLDAR